MKLFRRHIIALGLAVIYLTITVSPLASVVMRSKTVAYAMTGECVGDCDICGCSPESRANKTCCCAIKKRMEQHRHTAEQHDSSEKTAASTDNDADKKTGKCCKKNKAGTKVTVLSCNCPCGKGKTLATGGAGKNELVPYRFAESISPPSDYGTYHITPQRLTSRHPEPPVPPPKLVNHA
ncbi:hypothetical protein [Geobacter sp. SVR]|uniref:hypothetical protein n=1 Tax=Geobacter sp. SVR TaxID=2495594 RepID=UPI00143EFAE7|nr:hypothetical protein [Geobacter sp. SVR]BCS55338.1 hypothetical protein GSVR_36460 [Geobacter sp. SVR]GCF87263.1 hypothetical protein GSbR_38630 [Geobacter sp. SVR]